MKLSMVTDMIEGKAAVMVSPGNVEIWDLPVAPPPPGGVLVRVVLGGVC